MTMPKVTPDIINSIGEQMRDRTYMLRVEEAMAEENPHLAHLCNESMNSLCSVIEDPAQLRAAQIVGRVVYLLTYNSVKQQMIVDELS